MDIKRERVNRFVSVQHTLELCQIIELPLAYLLDPLAGGYLAGHNSTGVLSGYRCIAGWLHGLGK
jgi:hypothetical protein